MQDRRGQNKPIAFWKTRPAPVRTAAKALLRIIILKTESPYAHTLSMGWDSTAIGEDTEWYATTGRVARF